LTHAPTSCQSSLVTCETQKADSPSPAERSVDAAPKRNSGININTHKLLAGAVLALAFPLYSQTPDAFNPGPNNYASPIAIQADGKIVFGGGFTSVSGQSRGRVARVNGDGTLENGFNPGANGDVYSLTAQPDGKILVGGDFTLLGGQARTALGRLNSNGTLDTTFTTTAFSPPPFGSVVARAQAVLLAPDGKLRVGGRIAYNGGPTAGYVFRLNTNGSTDITFSTGGIGGGPVTTLAWQPDGKIVVGGLFSSVGGGTHSRIARLNADGAVDSSFNGGLGGITPIALALAVQPDGMILVGGTFTSAGGEAHTNICRLNTDGTPDSSFNASAVGVGSTVYSLTLQADGKTLVGGLFNMLNGVAHSRIGRLNADGSEDSSFTAGANSDVYGLAMQGDARILVGGFLTQLAGR
jgi:uncharacterized delta-60 repeat protein